MEWIRSGELQGIAALVTTLHIIVIAGRSLVGARVTPGTGAIPAAPDMERPRPGIAAHILGGVVVVTIAWLLYSLPWIALAFAMNYPATMVLSMIFFMLGSFTVLGALATRWTPLGGFLGGGIPLGTIALFYSTSTAQNQATAPPFTWFVVGAIFGGMIGALSGPGAIRCTERLGLPLPLRGKS